MNAIRWLWLTTLGLLQSSCDHRPEHVTADITEGDSPTKISWCRACGAYRLDRQLDWNEPYPLWLRGKGERP